MHDLTFPDEAVIRTEIDTARRSIVFELTGAFSDRQLGPGRLSVHDWKTISQRIYKHDVDQWIDVPNQQFEGMKSIEESGFSVDHLAVRGFGATSGNWVEFKVCKCPPSQKTCRNLN